MATFRVNHEKNPYMLIVKALIQDDSVSVDCRWLLAYLLSHGSEKEIVVSDVVNDVKHGVPSGKVYEIFNEATQAGYLEKTDTTSYLFTEKAV